MQNSLINFNTDQLAPFTVGFDSLFDRLFDLDTSSTGYPPYDIIKTKEHTYVIEMALAGFSKNDIKIETSDGVLTVKSTKKNTSSDGKNETVHKGISQRNFMRKFTLSDDITVKSADMENGMLSIKLERVLPEHKKPKLIQIK